MNCRPTTFRARRHRYVRSRLRSRIRTGAEMLRQRQPLRPCPTALLARKNRPTPDSRRWLWQCRVTSRYRPSIREKTGLGFTTNRNRHLLFQPPSPTRFVLRDNLPLLPLSRKQIDTVRSWLHLDSGFLEASWKATSAVGQILRGTLPGVVTTSASFRMHRATIWASRRRTGQVGNKCL